MLQGVLAFVGGLVVAVVVVKLLVTFDTRVEKRRRKAAQIAPILSNIGLKRLPKIFIAYSVGDYSGMGQAIIDFCTILLSGEQAILDEVAEVFGRVLEKKLLTKEGRAAIRAQLEEAEKAAGSASA